MATPSGGGDRKTTYQQLLEQEAEDAGVADTKAPATPKMKRKDRSTPVNTPSPTQASPPTSKPKRGSPAKQQIVVVPLFVKKEITDRQQFERYLRYYGNVSLNTAFALGEKWYEVQPQEATRLQKELNQLQMNEVVDYTRMEFDKSSPEPPLLRTIIAVSGDGSDQYSYFYPEYGLTGETGTQTVVAMYRLNFDIARVLCLYVDMVAAVGHQQSTMRYLATYHSSSIRLSEEDRTALSALVAPSAQRPLLPLDRRVFTLLGEHSMEADRITLTLQSVGCTALEQQRRADGWLMEENTYEWRHQLQRACRYIKEDEKGKARKLMNIPFGAFMDAISTEVGNYIEETEVDEEKSAEEMDEETKAAFEKLSERKKKKQSKLLAAGTLLRWMVMQHRLIETKRVMEIFHEHKQQPPTSSVWLSGLYRRYKRESTIQKSAPDFKQLPSGVDDGEEIVAIMQQMCAVKAVGTDQIEVNRRMLLDSAKGHMTLTRALIIIIRASYMAAIQERERLPNRGYQRASAMWNRQMMFVGLPDRFQIMKIAHSSREKYIELNPQITKLENAVYRYYYRGDRISSLHLAVSLLRDLVRNKRPVKHEAYRGLFRYEKETKKLMGPQQSPDPPSTLILLYAYLALCQARTGANSATLNTADVDLWEFPLAMHLHLQQRQLVYHAAEFAMMQNQIKSFGHVRDAIDSLIDTMTHSVTSSSSDSNSTPFSESIGKLVADKKTPSLATYHADAFFAVCAATIVQTEMLYAIEVASLLTNRHKKGAIDVVSPGTAIFNSVIRSYDTGVGWKYSGFAYGELIETPKQREREQRERDEAKKEAEAYNERGGLLELDASDSDDDDASSEEEENDNDEEEETDKKEKKEKPPPREDSITTSYVFMQIGGSEATAEHREICMQAADAMIEGEEEEEEEGEGDSKRQPKKKKQYLEEYIELLEADDTKGVETLVNWPSTLDKMDEGVTNHLRRCERAEELSDAVVVRSLPLPVCNEQIFKRYDKQLKRGIHERFLQLLLEEYLTTGSRYEGVGGSDPTAKDAKIVEDLIQAELAVVELSTRGKGARLLPDQVFRPDAAISEYKVVMQDEGKRRAAWFTARLKDLHERVEIRYKLVDDARPSNFQMSRTERAYREYFQHAVTPTKKVMVLVEAHWNEFQTSVIKKCELEAKRLDIDAFMVKYWLNSDWRDPKPKPAKLREMLRSSQYEINRRTWTEQAIKMATTELARQNPIYERIADERKEWIEQQIKIIHDNHDPTITYAALEHRITHDENGEFVVDHHPFLKVSINQYRGSRYNSSPYELAMQRDVHAARIITRGADLDPYLAPNGYIEMLVAEIHRHQRGWSSIEMIDQSFQRLIDAGSAGALLRKKAKRTRFRSLAEPTPEEGGEGKEEKVTSEELMQQCIDRINNDRPILDVFAFARVCVDDIEQRAYRGADNTLTSRNAHDGVVIAFVERHYYLRQLQKHLIKAGDEAAYLNEVKQSELLIALRQHKRPRSWLEQSKQNLPSESMRDKSLRLQRKFKASEWHAKVRDYTSMDYDLLKEFVNHVCTSRFERQYGITMITPELQQQILFIRACQATESNEFQAIHEGYHTVLEPLTHISRTQHITSEHFSALVDIAFAPTTETKHRAEIKERKWDEIYEKEDNDDDDYKPEHGGGFQDIDPFSERNTKHPTYPLLKGWAGECLVRSDTEEKSSSPSILRSLYDSLLEMNTTRLLLMDTLEAPSSKSLVEGGEMRRMFDLDVLIEQSDKRRYVLCGNSNKIPVHVFGTMVKTLPITTANTESDARKRLGEEQDDCLFEWALRAAIYFEWALLREIWEDVHEYVTNTLLYDVTSFALVVQFIRSQQENPTSIFELGYFQTGIEKASRGVLGLYLPAVQWYMKWTQGTRPEATDLFNVLNQPHKIPSWCETKYLLADQQFTRLLTALPTAEIKEGDAIKRMNKARNKYNQQVDIIGKSVECLQYTTSFMASTWGGLNIQTWLKTTISQCIPLAVCIAAHATATGSFFNPILAKRVNWADPSNLKMWNHSTGGHEVAAQFIPALGELIGDYSHLHTRLLQLEEKQITTANEFNSLLPQTDTVTVQYKSAVVALQRVATDMKFESIFKLIPSSQPLVWLDSWMKASEMVDIRQQSVVPYFKRLDWVENNSIVWLGPKNVMFHETELIWKRLPLSETRAKHEGGSGLSALRCDALVDTGNYAHLLSAIQARTRRESVAEQIRQVGGDGMMRGEQVHTDPIDPFSNLMKRLIVTYANEIGQWHGQAAELKQPVRSVIRDPKVVQPMVHSLRLLHGLLASAIDQKTPETVYVAMFWNDTRVVVRDLLVEYEFGSSFTYAVYHYLWIICTIMGLDVPKEVKLIWPPDTINRTFNVHYAQQRDQLYLMGWWALSMCCPDSKRWITKSEDKSETKTPIKEEEETKIDITLFETEKKNKHANDSGWPRQISTNAESKESKRGRYFEPSEGKIAIRPKSIPIVIPPPVPLSKPPPPPPSQSSSSSSSSSTKPPVAVTKPVMASIVANTSANILLSDAIGNRYAWPRSRKADWEAFIDKLQAKKGSILGSTFSASIKEYIKGVVKWYDTKKEDDFKASQIRLYILRKLLGTVKDTYFKNGEATVTAVLRLLDLS